MSLLSLTKKGIIFSILSICINCYATDSSSVMQVTANVGNSGQVIYKTRAAFTCDATKANNNPYYYTIPSAPPPPSLSCPQGQTLSITALPIEIYSTVMLVIGSFSINNNVVTGWMECNMQNATPGKTVHEDFNLIFSCE